MSDIYSMSLLRLAELLRDGKLCAEDITAACLERVRSDELNNFITVADERDAIARAKTADGLLRSGKAGLLCGVPYAVKDNIEVSGMRTSCASRALEKHISNKSAAVIDTLDCIGAVLLGKTNMDEFAMGGTNEYSAFGPVKNCRNTLHVSGGSSGGSANCVAAGQAFFALGSDTGGSVRQPAAHCGVVGLKPTAGLIDTAGLVGFSRTLDRYGILARDADDAYAVLCSLAGKSYESPLDGNVNGLRIGIADGFSEAAELDGEVRNEFNRAVRALSARGAKIVHIDIKSFRSALPAYHVISSAEVASGMMRGVCGKPLAEVEGLLGEEVRRRIVTGTYVLTGDNYDKYYITASRVRSCIKREFAQAFADCDLILTPTAPTTAPEIGEKTSPLVKHSSDMFTAPASLADLPAASVPFGTAHGLPVGVQIIGKANSERLMLSVGRAIISAA